MQVEDQRRSISEAVLQYCVMPRVTVTPEDALFCATFFHKLHALETPNFSSLQYYDRVVKDVFPVVYCATDREAHCLGVFLRATFEPLKRWRFDKRLYDKEAASKSGFSVAIGSPARCSYDQYCTVFFKWYDKITKIAFHCLDQYKDHGRACLLVLIKLVGIYPVRKRVNTLLINKLDAIRKQEDMKDLQAMAQRYHTLLSKRKDTMFEDPPVKHNLPGNKPLSSILLSKRQTTSALKNVLKELHKPGTAKSQPTIGSASSHVSALSADAILSPALSSASTTILNNSNAWTVPLNASSDTKSCRRILDTTSHTPSIATNGDNDGDGDGVDLSLNGVNYACVAVQSLNHKEETLSRNTLTRGATTTDSRIGNNVDSRWCPAKSDICSSEPPCVYSNSPCAHSEHTIELSKVQVKKNTSLPSRRSDQPPKRSRSSTIRVDHDRISSKRSREDDKRRGGRR